MKDHEQLSSKSTLLAEDIFFDALGFEDADAQKAFVEQACKGNEALRLQVDSLFVSLQEVGNFMEDDSALWISAKDLYDTLSSFPQFQEK